MFRAFNMGIGMIAVVAQEEAAALVEEWTAAGERAWIAGEIVEGDGRVELV
jgi:phosphoribosylformylglycinamidine cyclo-ligase